MPPALQLVARLFPPTYVFEAARASLQTRATYWDYVWIASIENPLYLALATWFFPYMVRRSRQTAQFARNEE